MMCLIASGRLHLQAVRVFYSSILLFQSCTQSPKHASEIFIMQRSHCLLAIERHVFPGPGATPGRSVAGTPLVRGVAAGPAATPARTPARDALGLNTLQVQQASTPSFSRNMDVLCKPLQACPCLREGLLISCNEAGTQDCRHTEGRSLQSVVLANAA